MSTHPNTKPREDNVLAHEEFEALPEGSVVGFHDVDAFGVLTGHRTLRSGRWFKCDEAGTVGELAEEDRAGDASDDLYSYDEFCTTHLVRRGQRETVRCQCGEITGEACAWEGEPEHTVTIEFMPEALRPAHVAAGRAGSYPHNGARRVVCHTACAETLCAVDPEWVRLVDQE